MRNIPQESLAGGDIVDLSSNDYLGLASRPELQAEFFSRDGVCSIPMTSSASRLLAGRQDEYACLEAFLSDLYGRPALLFNSGYHANVGMVSAIARSASTLIVADKLVHASIIDGITLSKSRFTRFRHNDMAHLESIIEKESSGYGLTLVVVESVYSMDGDMADITELVAIKRRHPGVMLYVDEAHAFGVVGERGLGLCRGTEGYEDVDVVVGTFGKACASMGAFCAVSGELRQFFVNRSRSFIFSTALPPMVVAWTQFIISKMLDMDAERERLKALGLRLHEMLSPLSPGFAITPSHIQPLVVGSPVRAVELSAKLMEHGFKVLPIRVPTVPPGTDRLRISLSAALSMADVERFGHTLQSILQMPEVYAKKS